MCLFLCIYVFVYFNLYICICVIVFVCFCVFVAGCDPQQAAVASLTPITCPVTCYWASTKGGIAGVFVDKEQLLHAQHGIDI